MRILKQIEAQGAVLFRWRSFLPLLVLPLAVPALFDSARFEQSWGEALSDAWMIVCLLLSLSGLALRGLTVGFVPSGTSGRNTRAQRAESLNISGAYSIVRNPLYLANFIVAIAIALATTAWWFALVVCLAYWLYIERIIAAEESFLAEKFGPAYDSWAEATPAFFPRLSQWRRPTEPFSIRTVLRREYNGLLTIVLSFVTIELATDLLAWNESLADWLRRDWGWAAVLATGVAIFLVLRTLKKRTQVLHVAGR